MKNQPITAKIKRTTQGGMVTQPILNMGTPVQMKASAFKQTNGPFGATYQKKMAEKKLAKEKASVQKDMAKYKEGLSQYKKDEENLKNIPEYSRGPISGRMSRFEKQYGARMKGEAGWAADDKARKNKTGQYKPEKSATKGGDVKKEGKATRSMKDYKVGSQARRDEYTRRGWKQDDTTKAAAVPTIKSIGIQPLSVETKLTGKIDAAIIKPKGKKVEPTKKQARQAKSIDKKLTKAKAARDAGNIKKAERKERAASKKAARLARKAAK